MIASCEGETPIQIVVSNLTKSSAPEMPKKLQPHLEDHPKLGKWLGSPPFTSHLGHLEGEQPYLGVLLIMVINHWD